MRFQDFEALVHHGCGIDGNLLAHAPHRVIERIGNGDGFKLLDRPFAERSAGGRNLEEFHFFFGATGKALENGAMFGINRRNEGFRIFGEFIPNDRARHDHRLFVGERHMFAMFDSGNGREAAHGTHQGVDDDVGFRIGGEFAEAVHAGEHRHAEFFFEFLGGSFVEHAHAFHLELAETP